MSAVIFLLACATIAYTGFCRLVRVDIGTALAIRLSMWLLTVAAATSATAVLIWGYQAGWPSAWLAVSMALVQVATSRLWRAGVPRAYRTQA